MLMALFSIGQVWGASPATLSFTAKCNGSGTDSDGNSWTITSDGNESNFDSDKGIHYGTNNAYVQYVQLSTSGISGTITQVVVNAYDAQSKATASVTVGGTAYTCSGSASVTNTSANFTFTGSSTGEIVVKVDRGSSMKKAIYVKSVVVTYTTGGSTVAVTSVTLDESAITLDEEATQTLTATVLPENATNKNVTWESNSEDVATVVNGVVTAKGAGDATIKCKSVADETKYAECAVHVNPSPYSKSNLIFDAACGGTGTADDDAEWTVTSDGEESVYDATSGIHYGTGSANVTYLQLATSEIVGSVVKVVVNARDAQATATISVTVGGTAFTCSKSTTATNTSTDYTFTGTGSGEIVVRVDRGSSMAKAIYVKSVKVSYIPSASVKKPSFSVEGGSYLGAQEVEITCATAGANIFYTLDGNDPTSGSTPYNGAISITETKTLKAIAIKDEVSSPIATATYTIINTAHAGTAEDPYSVADAKIVIDGIGTKEDAYVSGKISQVDEYLSSYKSITYWISADGTTSGQQLKVYSGKGIDGADFSSIDDVVAKATVVVKGTLKKYNDVYEFDYNNQLVSYAAPVEPIVTLSPSSLNLEAEGNSTQEITLTATNFENEVNEITCAFYNTAACDGEAISQPAWITNLTDNNSNQVSFDVADNDGDARQVWMKVTASDGTNSAFAVLAISQAKYTVDYAELPFAFDGGRADINDVDGMTQDGLDTDYGDSPKLKFKTAGTSVIIKINEDPGTLTYDIKGNSFSNGTFDVLQSANGTDYMPVATYTELGAVQSESKTLAQTTRYVKFVYTTKVNGNVALGNITISAYVAPTACEAPTFTPGTGETFTETLDVVLASATPGATIYYTLDESEPNTSSSVFDTKITLTESKTIKAIAVKDGLSNSSVASASFTKVLIIDSYEIDFETNDLAPYVNWEFSNIAIRGTAITAHGGSYYASNASSSEATTGTASCTITTKAKYANPGTLTFYISKESNNTTASSWVAQVSEDGTDWTDIEPSFDAKSMTKGDWNKCEADLSAYTNVYVRIAYSGSTAIRAIDDISLEPAAAVKKPVISNGESFLTSAEVSITCGTTGATIYYTTDGSDPKSGSEYSSSFTLTETATVRAIAKLDEDWSAEAESKTFTKITVVNVATALSASENDNVYVQGTITSITEVNTGFKNATYVISDMSAGLPQNEMIVYRGKYVDGADFTSADQIHIGDVVVVSGTIGIHDAKNQLAQGNQIETISAPAVAAPAFTPDGGGFMGETDVTISCTTDNSTIYYTIDGSTNPTKSSDEYTGAIHLAATTTIKAIAYVGDEPSMVVTKTFTLSEPMTVAEACTALDSDAPINNAAVSGIVYQVDAITGGKATYWISDDGTDENDVLQVYNGLGLNGADFAEGGIQIGDEVTVFGNLTIHNTTKEFSTGSRLLAFNRPVFAVTGVEVDETATVKVNKTVQLTANVLPVNATNKNVTWSVKAGSEAYAEVSATGLVTGKGQGVAIIVVTTEEGTFSDECTVTVLPGPPANTDIITAEEIGVGTSYEAWSGKNGFGTSSVYAGNSMTGTGDHAGAIQLRYNTAANKQSGIVLTASNGLYLKNLSVTINGDPANTLNVYAKATAYDGYSDLYSNDEATRGTLIGTVSATGNMTLVDDESISYNNNYQFIGMRSANGALYLDDITITWGDAYVAPTKYSVTYAAGEGSGDAPDAVEYEENETFEVAAGNLFTAPEGKEFDKWNDGTNDYEPGDTYTVGTADVVLTAQWKDVTPEPSYGSYNRDELTIGDYGTICLPKAGTISGAVLFDIADYAGSMIYCDQVVGNTVEAGKPYIFQATSDKLTVTYTSDVEASAGNFNGLYGSYSQVELAANGYNHILYNNQFYRVSNSKIFVGENRAYIQINMINYSEPAPGRRRVAMSVNGNQMPTEVEGVEINNAPRKVVINGELYILRGEKMYDVRGQLVK